jgi:hypothetical protein
MLYSCGYQHSVTGCVNVHPLSAALRGVRTLFGWIPWFVNLLPPETPSPYRSTGTKQWHCHSSNLDAPVTLDIKILSAFGMFLVMWLAPVVS